MCQSGVALRFPPQSKKFWLRPRCMAPWRLCALALNSVCLGALACALGLSALATPDAPIPLDQLSAVAGQQYHGDGLAVNATPEGAQLRCVFQRLTGRVTPEGLWLESTEAGGGQLHLRATRIGREISSDRSGIFVARPQPEHPAPSGAAYSDEVFSLGAMPRLPELEDNFWGLAFYNDVAPDGAVGPLVWGDQTLPRTGSVSVQDGLVQFRRAGLVEEYSVSMEGVRQDFVVLERPELGSSGRQSAPFASGGMSEPTHVGCYGGAGEMRVELELTGARAEAVPNGVRLTLDGSGRELVYSRLRVADATGKELPARMEVMGSAEVGDWSGGGGVVAASRQSAAVVVEREDGGGLPTRRYARLAVLVEDAEAVYPVRIDPTFSDADWVSLNPGIPGANEGWLNAIATDAYGNVYIGGEFTFAGTVAANYIAKWDGTTWSALGSGVDYYVRALAVSGSDLYVGGNFTNASGVTAWGLAKWNGASWSAVGSGRNGSVSGLVVDGNDLYACGNFSLPGQTTAKRIAKWNGSTWSSLGWVSGGSYPGVYCVAMIGGNLYVGGPFTTVNWDLGGGATASVPANCIAKWNGSVWSALGSGLSVSSGFPRVRALAGIGTDIYAGGYFTTAGGVPANFIAKWDGGSWSALGSGVGPDFIEVRALAVMGTDLYAGGYFTTAGGVTANYIAKWNGSTWSPLDSGTSGYVNALAASGSNLYAGGPFTRAGQVGADRIARWDGNTWAALGSGMSGGVSALAISGSDLYVGGSFASFPANYIAKWNGSAWSALGSGMNGSVSALAISGTDLYAGGAFTTAGGVSANRIAKWNGSSWSALGSGMSGSSSPAMLALAISGADLYAGGRFSTAGGVTANAIAKWNGSAWSALGSGMSDDFEGYGHPYVTALAVNGTDLYAAGSFRWAGGVFTSGIAKWNGSTWSALASGMNNVVRALALSESILHAGGDFTTAGGEVVNKVAKWDGNAWSPWGWGMNGSVSALAVSGANVYAGGSFTTADGLTANRVAKWDGVSTWFPLGSGLGLGSVTALAADEAGHLFVGGSFVFAGTNVSPYIAQANLTPQPMIIEGIRVEACVATLDCRAAAGGVCAVQRATDMQFTQDLTTLHTTNVPPDGRFTCTDASAPATTAFYRLYQP